MGAQDDVHDTVAAKIAAHNAAILADLSKPRRRKSTGGTGRRNKQRTVINGEQPLFAGVVTRTESFGQTRARVEPIDRTPARRLPDVRRSEVRCTDCDYRLVVRSAKVICPHCGQIYGDPAQPRSLMDAFPGATFLGDGEPA